jgi:hypothetical protein
MGFETVWAVAAQDIPSRRVTAARSDERIDLIG